MPNTIKYSTTGDTLSLEKGNFYIGVGDVPKGPTSTTGHWQGITPPLSGYTIYINKASDGPTMMVPENDAKLVEYTNGISSNQTNYISNGGNFGDGTISPFNSNYSDPGGLGQVVSIANDLPYADSKSKNALYLNYNGGRVMSSVGLLTTGVTYTFSFWAKIISGSSFTALWNNQNGLGDTNAWSSSANLTTSWQRYSQTFTYNSAKNNFYFYSRSADTTRAAVFTEFQVTTGYTYGGPGLQTANESLKWFAGIPNDTICVNKDYEPIITDGLVLNVDASFTPSYPKNGNTWFDTSYSGVNSTLVNGITYGPSNGGSIVFDGTNDYAVTQTNINPPNITLEFFYKSLINDSYQYLISNARDCCGTYKGYELRVVTGLPRFSIWNSSESSVIGSSILLNQINHLAATYNGSQSRIYQNGALISTTNSTLGIGNPPSYNLAIGGMGLNPAAYNLNGEIYLGRIYNRPLTPSEILQNYQSTFTRFLGENIVTNGLVSYLDAGYGTSYPTTGTTWYDISGYNKNGTLTNGPTYSTDGGGSIVFDGIDDSVTLGSFTGNFISNPSLNNGIISFSCWVYVSNPSSYYIISSGSQTTSTGVAFSYQNGSPFVSVKGQNFTAEIIIGAVNFPLNTWINFTFVANGNTLITYKNGVLLQSTNYVSATWSDTASLLTIARPNNTTSLTLGGKVAITSFYNKALSSDEVLQNYQSQFTRFLGEKIITDGLRLYLDAGYTTSYPTTGTTFYDVSGYGNNGSLINGGTFDSANGGSIVLDGVDDIIRVPNTNGHFSVGTGAFTIDVWIFLPVVPSWNYIHLFAFDNQSNWAFKATDTIGNGNLYFYGGSNQYRSYPNDFGVWRLQFGVWQHVCITRDGSTHRAYYNGEFVGQFLNAPKSITCTNLNIGWGSGSEYTQQKRGPIKFYNRALTTNEILQNFNAQKSRFGL
jgi:hypothetical protein